MRELTRAAITVVANWWFENFKAPSHGNGARELPSVMAGVIRSDLANQYPVTEEQRQPFIDALLKITEDKNPYAIHIGADYSPEEHLADAMQVAGIDHSRCSFKTHVRVGHCGIQVAPGHVPTPLIVRLVIKKENRCRSYQSGAGK
jgi:hypothetical protein